jgi:hypothetical protein
MKYTAHGQYQPLHATVTTVREVTVMHMVDVRVSTYGENKELDNDRCSGMPVCLRWGVHGH